MMNSQNIVKLDEIIIQCSRHMLRPDDLLFFNWQNISSAICSKMPESPNVTSVRKNRTFAGTSRGDAVFSGNFFISFPVRGPVPLDRDNEVSIAPSIFTARYHKNN
ncbi:hypothetical protein WA026_000928 [Henosepilachna vigintioctopunctata]|uniref:Uncharacterized protein n=1 Tax=Henosepilachna vigintioctopunctata TaxID=420089 RepID=A0AAW1V6J4_9CUCU